MTARSRGSGRRLDLGDHDVVELLEEGDALCGDFVEAACRGPAGVRGSLRWLEVATMRRTSSSEEIAKGTARFC
jgi:hypothetical protein